jgi:hypothetical protein
MGGPFGMDHLPRVRLDEEQGFGARGTRCQREAGGEDQGEGTAER